MALSQMGMIGLGVMGRNLALNLEDHDYSVAVWNLEPEKTEAFIEENKGKRFTGTRTFEELVASLEKPRRIMMMIKAGAPVDSVIGKIAPLLDKGDILFDGGNSHFDDTRRREEALREKGIRFFGVGISGGEEGARNGPSIMPGGDREGYEHLRPVLEAIAARSESGPCVAYLGPDGAGHFVKMVHNGIEYGDMQLIAEAYDILSRGLDMSADELATLFAKWNEGPLASFLMELTAKIFTVRDPETGEPLVEKILDKAGQKGTGRWTVQTALELGVSIPTISAALDARILSSLKDERVAASSLIEGGARDSRDLEKADFIEAVRDALYASKITAYAQGMKLIREASKQYEWNVDLREVARIWKAGCIIRASLLDPIMNAFETTPDIPSLLVHPPFREAIAKAEKGWRFAVRTAMHRGIPVPAMAASLMYFDSYRTADLPQNLTQAQRDAFGAHTYIRKDRPSEGAVHTDWLD
ncbi:MAG: NADP-dependent phosphogluconate dehydrogenase [Gemmatimonadetes bacterium]|nr:NADP-dependent phosphogluconate dehydrogenase [Gemmatimonadota bacterium]